MSPCGSVVAEAHRNDACVVEQSASGVTVIVVEGIGVAHAGVASTTKSENVTAPIVHPELRST
jgi:hypothetical protein